MTADRRKENSGGHRPPLQGFPISLMDLDVRALGDKTRDRRSGERFHKLRAVERRDIGVELCGLRFPQMPARMFDAVFAASITSRGVTPVMFGDEFLVRPVAGTLRLADCSHRQRFPAPAASPLILSKDATVLVLERVPHRQRQIRLAIKRAGDERDGSAWHQLPNENDTAPPFARAFPPDIKTEIHFLEIAMERDGQTDEARIEKKEANDADERLALMKVELGLDGNERLKNFRVDGEVQHCQVTPVRGEKRFQHDAL